MDFVVTLIACQIILTILGFTWLYLRFGKTSEDIKIVLMEEVNSSDGFLKKTYTVRIKQQIFYKNIPLGQPTVVIENVVEEANKEQIERILKDYVEPFLSLGKNIVEIKSGNFFSRMMK